MSHTTLIDTATLATHLDDPGWVVLDCRHDLARPGWGRAEYLRSHIPGARFMHLDEDLSGPLTGKNGRHPLPDHRVLATKLGDAGIAADTQVVAYDAHGGVYAARAWWMLRSLGHARVAVLDGGYDKWQREARPTTAAPPQIEPKQFAPSAPTGVVDVSFVATRLRDPRMRLVDARAPDRYRGENETLDPVAGHVPGAVNRFFKLNLNADTTFKPAAELAAEWRSVLGSLATSDVVHMCGSGVTACHNLLAMEIAGLSGSRLYAGSWSEWCADAARPIATGSEP
jgi:thiosulfate/3-mercaptopyruvate sulfurtransferase